MWVPIVVVMSVPVVVRVTKLSLTWNRVSVFKSEQCVAHTYRTGTSKLSFQKSRAFFLMQPTG